MHTKGKWTKSDGAILSECVNSYGNFIVVAIERERTTEDEDNLTLIAAAPDLLAACEKALNVLKSEPACDIYTAHRDVLEAAIAKAKGGV